MRPADAPEVSSASPPATVLESVVARFAGMVRDVGRRHRLSDADVDELFQEVRIRLWKASERGERLAAVPVSYVYKTATTAALDLIRRQRRARTEPLDAAGSRRSSGEGVVIPDPSAVAPDRGVLSSELALQVAAAVDSITPSRRPVVRLYLRGYDRAEIGALLGWSEAKTRNLLYRGLADLRERLAERGIGPETRS